MPWRLFACILAFAGAACSSSSSKRCGDGTQVQGASCVPAASAAEHCGRGTHLDGERCAPDATPDAFCGPGTVPAGGSCVPSSDPSAWCGPGTVVSAGSCVAAADPIPSCGPGTKAQEGLCVLAADGSSFCGPGTTSTPQGCAPAAAPESFCGPGTVLAGTVCAPALDLSAFCGPGTVIAAGRCAPAEAPSNACGPGTRVEDGRCVAALDPALLCGPGTSLSGEACVLADPAPFCGPGTVLQAGLCSATLDPAARCGPGTTFAGSACIPSAAAADHCGAGTVLSGGRCLPASSPADHCGSGTHLDGTVCLADPDPEPWCGPGTYPAAGQCLPASTQGYEVRLVAPSAPADGFSRVPVQVLGPAGAAPQAVTLKLSRASAGALDGASVQVGPLGGSTWFVPCAAASSGCLGKVRIAAYLPSDLATPVAVSEPLALVPATGVGTPAPCLVAGNVLFFDGDGYVIPGVETITDAEISAGGSPLGVNLGVYPHDPAQGDVYMLSFGTKNLGVEMTPGVYEDAISNWTYVTGHAGMDLTSDRACDPRGRFQVHRFDLVERDRLVEFLATFDFDCSSFVSRRLRGCIRYTAP